MSGYKMVQTNYKKLDCPFSIRIPHKSHKQYKALSGFGRKQVQYKIVLSLKRYIYQVE